MAPPGGTGNHPRPVCAGGRLVPTLRGRATHRGATTDRETTVTDTDRCRRLVADVRRHASAGSRTGAYAAAAEACNAACDLDLTVRTAVLDLALAARNDDGHAPAWASFEAAAQAAELALARCH